jgi:polyphenol oxidase
MGSLFKALARSTPPTPPPPGFLMPMMLEILTSDALPVRHGFFTRKGGASSGIFAGLNCGPGSSDQAEVVAINRARVAEAMGVPPRAGDRASGAFRRCGPCHRPLPDKPRADAMVTATPGIALGVLTADCQPVLFADPRRGDRRRPCRLARRARRRAGGDGRRDGRPWRRPRPHRRRDRPHDQPAAYEVGPEFFEPSPTTTAPMRASSSRGSGDRYLFDLPAFGLRACARRAWAMPNGRATAPIAIRSDSSPTAAPPMLWERPITAA